MPKTFWDQMIHCDAGPHVVWGLPVTIAGAGFRARTADILRSRDNHFRPVDVAVAPDGSLFVSDWYDPVVGGFKQDDIERGRIYWVAPKGHKHAAPKYNLDSPEGVVEALKSPNYCARYLAWMTLHPLGAQAEQPLAKLLDDPNPRLRARALWLLGQIGEKASTYIARAMVDDHDEVRIVGLRLAHLLKHDVVTWIDKLADDPSARVRAECAVHLRHHDSAQAAQAWAKLAAKYEGKDRWYLEALGIGADRKWDACLDAYSMLKSNPSKAAFHDIVWRSRSTQTPVRLAEILKSSGARDDLRRYVRAFDFQSGNLVDDPLLSVAFDNNLPAEIALATLARISPTRLKQQAGGRDRLLELLGSSEFDGNAIELIQQYALEELYPRLLQTAQQENDLRVTAIRMLLELKQHELIVGTLNGADAVAASATARVVAKSLHADALKLLMPYVLDSSKDNETRKDVARDLCNSVSGAMKLLDFVERNQLPTDIQQAVAGRLLTYRKDNIRARSEKLFPVQTAKDARPLPKLRDLIGMQGNVERGAQVFLKEGKCAACHQVQGKGKPIGPDLSQIGTKLARSALFEAILYPSAAISHDYATYAASLKSGQVVTGILVNRNEDQIQLRDAEGILRNLNRSEAEAFKRQNVSLMPANLHEAMTAQALVDLVAYLTTLKLEPNPSGSLD